MSLQKLDVWLCTSWHNQRTYAPGSSQTGTHTSLVVALQHCRACGQTKSSEEFPRNRMNKDGLHSYCKPCQNAKCAQYQRNSNAAKQDSMASAGTPFDAAPEQPFTTHKVCSMLGIFKQIPQAMWATYVSCVWVAAHNNMEKCHALVLPVQPRKAKNQHPANRAECSCLI